jgi:regulator of sigma E protease
MWDMLVTLTSFVVTIGLLVTIHEFGHFWVARRCGVKVLRFSVGFGKPLLIKKDKQGTEFAIASIPLGGYVKMLDAREIEDIPAELKSQEFTQKPLLQRFAIVAAGPIANFLFAIFAYWLLFMIGVTEITPQVGKVAPDSPAERAGVPANVGRIAAIDQSQVNSWSDVGMQLLKRMGDTGEVNVLIEQGGQTQNYALSIENWLSDSHEPNPIRDLGILPKLPKHPVILDRILPEGAAGKAGLQSGDKVISVAGKPIDDWSAFVEVIKVSPNQPLALEVLRQDQIIELSLTPKTQKADDGSHYGYAGVGVKPSPLPDDWVNIKRLGPLAALWAGAEKTWDVSVAILDGIKKLILGALSVKNLSGPITIAKVAGDQAQQGFEAFISFLAYISVMLGIMNLLPVPVLDGGHLAFYLVEAVRGKPLSERIQQMGLSVGFALLLGIMAIAIVNDISRL